MKHVRGGGGERRGGCVLTNWGGFEKTRYRKRRRDYAPNIIESRFEEPFLGLSNSHFKGMSLALASVVRWRAADGTIWIDLGDARHCRLNRRSWSLFLCLVLLFLFLLGFPSFFFLFLFAKYQPVGKSRSDGSCQRISLEWTGLDAATAPQLRAVSCLMAQREKGNTRVEQLEVDGCLPEQATLVWRPGVGDYFLVMGLDALCNDAGPGPGQCGDRAPL